MPSYRVTWEIDEEADDAVTAARQAREKQLDPEAQVGVFDVMDKNARTERVDLDEGGGAEPIPLDVVLRQIERQLAHLKVQDQQIVPGQGPSISRVLDSIIETAAQQRAIVEGLTEKRRASFSRKVRRVLGYTYP